MCGSGCAETLYPTYGLHLLQPTRQSITVAVVRNQQDSP